MKSVKVVVGTNWSTSVPLKHMRYACMDTHVVKAVESGSTDLAALLVSGKIKRKIVAKNLRIETVPTGTAFRICQDTNGNEAIQYLGTDIMVAEAS